MPGDPARVFSTSYSLEAPPDRVYAAWTDPALLAQWWGPHTFTAEITAMDVQPGGAYRFVMRSPEGEGYPLRGRYREVVPPTWLVTTVDTSEHSPEWHAEVHRHGGKSGPNAVGEAVQTVTFTPAEGGTRIEVSTEFETPAIRDAMVEIGMTGGWRQCFEKLDDLLAAERQLITRRTLGFTPEEVYAAFADPERLARWWGPNGFRNTFSQFDLRPGGHWRFVMHGPEGTDYPNHSIFDEVEPAEQIVFRHLESVHEFRMTITLQEREQGTEYTWRMRFPTAEHFQPVRPMVTGANEQNFDRLEAELRRGSG